MKLSILHSVRRHTSAGDWGHMQAISMALPFWPTPKGRPRFKVKYNRVYTFTPRDTREFENQISDYYKGAAQGYKFPKGTPIIVSLDFGMHIPASTSKRRKENMINGLIHHAVKPDLDNLAKSVLDALNGVAWHDDAQIVELHVQKHYALSPHIYLSIHEKV